jgi:hypothetical protein
VFRRLDYLRPRSTAAATQGCSGPTARGSCCPGGGGGGRRPCRAGRAAKTLPSTPHKTLWRQLHYTRGTQNVRALSRCSVVVWTLRAGVDCERVAFYFCCYCCCWRAAGAERGAEERAGAIHDRVRLPRQGVQSGGGAEPPQVPPTIMAGEPTRRAIHCAAEEGTAHQCPYVSLGSAFFRP